VVTCAHVVNAALGRGLLEQGQPGESDFVQVEFPVDAGDTGAAGAGSGVESAA
jgi:hypothetical protein